MLSQNKYKFYSFIIVLMSIIYLLETYIPKPFPWFRIGFVNIILVLLIFYKFKLQEIITLIFLRTIITAIFLGNIFSLIFLVNLITPILAAIAMFYTYKILKTKITLYLICVVGAITNIFFQVLLFSLILFNSLNLLKMLPYFLLFAYVAGNISGILVNMIALHPTIKKIFAINENK